MSRRLALNSFSSTTLFVINAIIMFIMTPVLIGALGNRDYGLWELVMSVMGYMSLLDLGVGGALVRFVSVADGRQDRDDLQKTISTAFVFFILAGLVAVLLFFLISIKPNFVAGSNIKDIANLRTVFMLIGINAAIYFPLQVFVAALMGVQRHYFINNVRIILGIAQACIIYYLLHRFEGHGLIVLALMAPVITVVEFFVFAGAVYLDRNLPNISLLTVSVRKAKEIFLFSGKNVVLMASSRLQNASMPIIIAHVMGVAYIIYFTIPNRLVDYAKGLSMAISIPLTPYFGAAIGRGEQSKLLRSWLNTSLILQSISLTLPIAIFFCGEPFLKLWLGQEYAVAGRMVLYILLFGLLARSLASNAFQILIAQDRHGKCALIWLILSVLSIPLGITGAYLWGIEGVALATSFITVTANLITIYIACVVMHISITFYFRSTVVRLLFPLLLLVSTFTLIANVYPISNYTILILHLVTSGFVYLISLWLFTLDIDSRNWLLNKVGLKIINR